MRGAYRRSILLLAAFAAVSVSAETLPAASPGNDALAAVAQALSQGDVLAARSRLARAAAEQPDDCAVRGWLAWFEIETGGWGSAQAQLDLPGCPLLPEDRGRWALLRALAADRRDEDARAGEALRSLGESQPLWPEDRRLAHTLSARHLPGYTAPLEVRADGARGATSNAFASSPIDSAGLETPASAILRPGLQIRARTPAAAITPSLEIVARGHGFSAASARELSHAVVSAAGGLRLGRGRVGPTLRYRHEELLLDASGGRYAASDRGELEVEPLRHLTLLGGAGRRTFFEDDWRTRTEWELAGFLVTRLARWPLVVGAALRCFDARRTVHDQIGGTLSAASELPVRAELRARLAVSLSYDVFPRSGGRDGLVAFGTEAKRRDATLRLSGELWRPLTARAAVALRYELSHRSSTADASGLRYYPYSDHRLLVLVRVGHGGNPWRARSAQDAGRPQLPYRGLGEFQVMWDDEMRQLLRQEEDLASDCGCTVP